MKKITFSRGVALAVLAFVLGQSDVSAQTYNWTGGSADFYTAANWTSTEGPVLFDNGGFRVVHTNNMGTSPVINQFIDWQPGIFDAQSGNLTVNADFNCFFNDFLNGTVTINTGATFTCRNIIRVGREGMGTVNINGTMRSNSVPADWQGIFIGVLSGGNGTVNVNNGGVLNGGYQVEVGTRDFYPTGVLNINEGGLSEAYWETWIGPNGTINVNGGTVNTGKVLNVGNLYLDNAPNAGTLGEVVGTLNINSGSVTVNHNDLEAPVFALHNDAKITIDNGSLRIMRTGTDFSADINTHVTAGRILPATGKEIQVAYDGVYTTVTAQAIAGVSALSKNVFTVYPNPATDFLNIQYNGSVTDSVNITITNLLGEVVLQSAATSVSNTVDISALASGIYMVKTQSGNISSVTKIVKK